MEWIFRFLDLILFRRRGRPARLLPAWPGISTPSPVIVSALLHLGNPEYVRGILLQKCAGLSRFQEWCAKQRTARQRGCLLDGGRKIGWGWAHA